MGLREEIFGYLDDGKTTLVFPTENAARHWLSMYVRQRKTSVLADRAIALDSFKAMFAPEHERKPSNKYHRLSFISSLLASRSSSLKYLYNDSFHYYRKRFIPFLVRILPDLEKMDSLVLRSKALYVDLQTLRRRYSAFLDQNGLFEPGWEKCDFKNYKGPQLDHLLVGYDCDIQMQKLMAELGDIKGVGALSINDSKDLLYRQYQTEEAELNALFQTLEDLKLKGVSTSDIIISTPALENLWPRLERKALELNIPLSLMGSLDISATVPGRFLFSLERCIDERLSFRSIENLLLNDALPYLDMDRNRKLVRFMIDKNIQSGSLNSGPDALAASLGDDELSSFYKDLKNSLLALDKASDEQALSKALHAVAGFLFGPSEFNASCQGDRDVYSFILSELSNLGKVLSQVSLRMESMFAVFLDEVRTMSYVPQDARTGIRVYRYAQDQLLYVPWHFVVGVNDANSQIRESTMDFLEDHEVLKRETYDVTERLFDYYALCGDNVFMSGASASFEGAAGAPIHFILRDKVRTAEALTLEPFEKADLVSLSHARCTSMATHGPDFTTDGLGLPRDPKAKRISYTSISSYAKCPYKAFLSMDLLPKVPEMFEPAKQDDKKIGDFLHNVIQTFMEAHVGSFIAEQDLDSCHKEIEEILDRLLDENEVFDPFTKDSIRGNYHDALISVPDRILGPFGRKKVRIGPFKPLGNELEITDKDSFYGRIDTVIEDVSGNIHLLDYKKGSASATYQLVLYRRLYEEDPIYGEDVGQCVFYSMKEAKLKGFDAQAWESQSQKLEQDIKSMCEGYARGDWKATPSKESCNKCVDRCVCRRRFNLQ